ncbi:MAG: M23 family metallopeptidase [Coriobacteriia bacterium]|nr:M23 family metallopeptidase [Coriobacteriia bacterium]
MYIPSIACVKRARVLSATTSAAFAVMFTTLFMIGGTPGDAFATESPLLVTVDHTVATDHLSTDTPTQTPTRTFGYAGLSGIERIEQIIVAQEAQAEEERRARFYFPVLGEVNYTNDFYSARSNGAHRATDLLGAHGLPLVAIFDGEWVPNNSGMGGIGGYLIGDNGWKAFYAHMATSIPAGRVLGGQPVGTLGSTGNASTPHLHLELWDADGTLLNPYDLLPIMYREGH